MADPVLVLNVSDHPVHVAGVDINPGVAAWVDPTGGDVQASILAGVLTLNPNLSKADPVTFPGWPLGVELPGGSVPVGPAADLVAVEARARLAGDQDLRQRLDGLVAGTVDLTAVYTAITAESTAREATDASLAASIDTEATNRAAAIAAEVTARTSAISALAATVASRSTALTNETETRAAADANLTYLQDTERAQRIAADQALADELAGLATELQAEFDAFVGGVDTSAVMSEADLRASGDQALGTRIDTEAASRASAVNTLGARIDTEATARATADTSLSGRIDAEVAARGTAITNEAAARTSAITAEATARAGAITAEAAARDAAIAAAVAGIEGGAGATTLAELQALLADSGDAVAALVSQMATLNSALGTKETPAGAQAKVDTETAARQAADTSIAATVTAEASARAAADTSLGGRIDTEVAARISAISTEAAARTAGDSALDGRVATLETNLPAEVTNRTNAITTEAAARAAADTAETNARAAAVTVEAAARAAADTAEASARSTAIATAIAAEVTARNAADAIVLANATAYVDALDGIRGNQIGQEIVDRITGDEVNAGLIASATDLRTDLIGGWRTQPAAFKVWRTALANRATRRVIAVAVGDSVTEGVYGFPIDKVRAYLAAQFNGGRLGVGWVNASQKGFTLRPYRFTAYNADGTTPTTLGTYLGDADYTAPVNVGIDGYSWSLGTGHRLRLQQLQADGSYLDATGNYATDIEFRWTAQHSGSCDLEFWVTVDGVLTKVHTVSGTDINDPTNIATGATDSFRTWTYSYTRRQDIGAIEVRAVTGTGGSAPAIFDGAYISDGDLVWLYNAGHSGWRHAGTYNVVNRGLTGNLNVAAPGSGTGTLTITAGGPITNNDVGASVTINGATIGTIASVSSSTVALVTLNSFAVNATAAAIVLAPFGGVTGNTGHRQALGKLQPDLITEAHGINDVYGTDPSIVAGILSDYYAWATGYSRTVTATTVTTTDRTLTGVAGTFTTRDIGAVAAAAAGIPAGTQIVAVNSDGSIATLSLTCTAAGSRTCTITGPTPSFAHVFPYASSATGKTAIWAQVDQAARAEALTLGIGYISMFAVLGTDADSTTGGTDPYFADGAHLSTLGGQVYADAYAAALGIPPIDTRPTSSVRPFPLGSNYAWQWELDEASPAVGGAQGLFLRYAGPTVGGLIPGNAAIGLYTSFGLGVIQLGGNQPATISGGLNLLAINQLLQVPAAGIRFHDATLGDFYAELVASQQLTPTSYTSTGALRFALPAGDMFLDSTASTGLAGAILALTRVAGDPYPHAVIGHSFLAPYLGLGPGGRQITATAVGDGHLLANTGTFDRGDVGRLISGAGITVGTTITAYNSPTDVSLSTSPVITAITVTIGGQVDATLVRYITGVLASGITGADQIIGGRARLINSISGDYTVGYTDRAKFIVQTDNAAHTLTWPQDSDAAAANGTIIQIGTRIKLANRGTALVTHAAGTGATILGRAHCLPNEEQTATKISANTWLITGYNRDVSNLTGSAFSGLTDPISFNTATGKVELTSGNTTRGQTKGSILNLYVDPAEDQPYAQLARSFGSPFLGLGYGRRAFTSDTTAGTTLHSTDAIFASTDVGAPVSGTNIAAGTRILTFTDSTHVVLNQAVSGTLVGAADLKIGGAPVGVVGIAPIAGQPYPAAGLSGAEVMVGGRASLINNQTGTSYTPVATDRGKIITRNNAGASTMTWPQDTDASPIPIGVIIEVANIGAGTVTHAAGTGATLTGVTAQLPNTVVHAIKVAANTWLIGGSPVGPATTSAQLAAILSDEAGTGAVELATTPALVYGVNAQVGTTYAVLLSDVGKVITRNNASASTMTWPKDATQAIPVGTLIEVRQLGAGTVTHQAESGATITGTTSQTSTVLKLTALKTAANTWHIA